MDCICLNRRRRKKGRQETQNHKARGSQNPGYVEDDDDILQNNVVLAEIEQAEAETRLQEREQRDEADTKSGVSSADETNSLKVGGNGSGHAFLSPNCYTPHSTQDDLCLNHYNYECVEVDLLSKDTAGPGFSVTGTLTDGIIIGSLHEKGPALQTGKINAGDRILSVTVGFDNMTYEDALTILSYAAPYPMTLKLARGSNPQNDISAEPSSELNELNSRIYHPVYRSQSVGGGIHVTKNQHKIPSRPGTSLSQIDYATRETSNEGSQESLQRSLVKDKFGNTLNLIDANNSTLHVRLSSSDTTLDSSVRSNSYHESMTMLTETSEEVATAFTVPMQAVACFTETAYPIVAEAMVTEPPTQVKLATLGSGPNSMATSNSQSDYRVATPYLIPPEKPKRIYQLLAENEIPSSTGEGFEVQEEAIIPVSKPKNELVTADKPKCNTVNYSSMEARKNLLIDMPMIEDVELPDSIGDPSTPVYEPTIEPTQKINQLESSLNTPAWISHFEAKARDSMLELEPTIGSAVKPTTLTVDTVKIKDDKLEEASHSRQCSNTLEQPSPNDSGIHSEKALSEQDLEEATSPNDGEASSGSSSPYRQRMSRSTSEELLTTAFSLESPRDKKEDGDGSETPSSQVSTPRKLSLTGLFASSYVQKPPASIKRRRPRARSAGAVPTRTATPRFTQPEPVIPKATSRSQLEAARARFFAELMQNSELFKDSPSETLSFSSDSLNTETPELNDPFKKYINRDSARTATNNNSLSYVGSISNSESDHHYTNTQLATTAEDRESTA